MDNIKKGGGSRSGEHSVGTTMLQQENNSRLQMDTQELNQSTATRREEKTKLDGSTQESTTLDGNESDKGNYSVIKVDDMFAIVGGEKGYFIAFGMHRLSDVMDSVEECEELINSRDYRLLFNLIAMVCEKMIEEKLGGK